MLSEETRNKLTTIAENEQKVYDNGVADGKRAEYDAFWDALQNYGKRAGYTHVFSNHDSYNTSLPMGSWDETNFKPKYPIIPQVGDVAVFSGLRIANFKEHCEKNGIVIDLSQATSLRNWYRRLYTSHFPDMNVAKATSMNSCFYECNTVIESPDILNGELLTDYGSCYYNCSLMTTIPTLWATNVTTYSYTFYNCKALTEITKVEGEIKVNIDFKWSPLSPASLKSIVKHLKSYLGTSSEYAYTLTVKTSAWEVLVSAGCTDEDFAWIEETFGISKSLWEELGFTWTDIVGYLRWNLVLA